MSRQLKSLLFGALVAMVAAASGPATAADGETAKDEMARTYLCAAKAENCAIGLVQAGMECTAAKVRCGQIYPIPK
jgi:hypothetical protein